VLCSLCTVHVAYDSAWESYQHQESSAKRWARHDLFGIRHLLVPVSPSGRRYRSSDPVRTYAAPM